MKELLSLQLSSRKTDIMVAGSVLIFFVIMAGIWMIGDSEPRYHGRALSTWLEDLNVGKHAEVRECANAVLAEAAQEAAPEFIHTLRAKDSRLRLLIMGLAQRQNIINFRFQTADMRREQAMAEFSRFRMGAIPVLTNLLNDPQLAVQATSTLIGTGPEAIVHLIRLLDHTNDSVRTCAAEGLVSIYMNDVLFKSLVKAPGWQGDFSINATVAALCRHLKDRTPNVRIMAAFALGYMREQPENTVPALTECLEATTNSRERETVADALGKYAHDAVSAIPSLQPLVYDKDPVVRTAAERALRRIAVENESLNGKGE